MIPSGLSIKREGGGSNTGSHDTPIQMYSKEPDMAGVLA